MSNDINDFERNKIPANEINFENSKSVIKAFALLMNFKALIYEIKINFRFDFQFLLPSSGSITSKFSRLTPRASIEFYQ